MLSEAFAHLIVGTLAVLFMKITAMVIGYYIVKLGYNALVSGIKGEFDFGGKVTNKIELKLLSASPGLFFVLFGSAIILWSITVEKPISVDTEIPIEEHAKPHLEPEPMEAK